MYRAYCVYLIRTHCERTRDETRSKRRRKAREKTSNNQTQYNFHFDFNMPLFRINHYAGENEIRNRLLCHAKRYKTMQVYRLRHCIFCMCIEPLDSITKTDCVQRL